MSHIVNLILFNIFSTFLLIAQSLFTKLIIFSLIITYFHHALYLLLGVLNWLLFRDFSGLHIDFLGICAGFEAPPNFKTLADLYMIIVCP